MCGITGLVGPAPVDPAMLDAMASRLAHRGPDDAGRWTSPDGRVGFGFRRLAIVDLGPSGHQPITSHDGRWTIVFNGEIYNHPALRRELGRDDWRGHSDSETVVEAIAAWGIDAALPRLVGMFAIAAWDARDERLYLLRDRFGEKPLYYGWIGRQFAFASELKALRVVPGFEGAVDRRAVALLAARTYVPAPFSIYHDIYKLQPGCVLTLDTSAVPARPSEPPRAPFRAPGISVDRYWSYDALVADAEPTPADEETALERLDALVSEAVRLQLRADVPVGTFLSGGIDSSLIVAMARRHAAMPLKTFSIGFKEPAYNEADHARRVAEHFGSEHAELIVTARDAQAVIPLLPTIFDEPFADSSQVPTYILSRFARGSVTVALSGDGGDELFGGYYRHLRVPATARAVARVPRMLRGGAAALLDAVPTRVSHARKFAGLLRSDGDLFGVYASYVDEWFGRAGPVIGRASVRNEYDRGALRDAPPATRVMAWDVASYLPDDILCKTDRAAMAVSLETRLPLLDHRLAAFAAGLPLDLKIRGRTGKHLLRRLLEREAPAALFDRPKAGFGVPIGSWLRGPLRDWAEELLAERALKDGGMFDAVAVRRRWRDHLAGRADATYALWAVLMFEQWRRAA